MADNQKYYYLKLKENFFHQDTTMLLENMTDGILYSNLLLKMYLLSLKNEGILLVNERIPHTADTIAACTSHQIGTVERALKLFVELGLVEILNDGSFYMTNIELFIGKSSTEGERKKKARKNLELQRLLPENGADICPPSFTSTLDKCPPEIEREKEIDIELEKEREGTYAPTRPYGRYGNVILSDKELAELKTELPSSWENYIERLLEYMASKGKSYKNHAATIRRWAKEDMEKNKPKGYDRDYSVGEDEVV